MTPLRQRLIEEIELRGFSPHTKNCYVRWVADLARFRHASPDQITDEQVREYLLHLLHQRRLSPSSLIVAVSAIASEQATTDEWLGALQKALQRIPASSREAIALVCFDGCCHKDAAARLGCTVKAVETRLYHGRNRLKGELKRMVG